MALPNPGGPDRTDAIVRTLIGFLVAAIAGALLITGKGDAQANYVILSGALAIAGANVSYRRPGGD